MDINQLKQIMQDAGVVGAGGAGFPTYMKLDKKVDTIVLNCAECEPLLKVHRQLLANYAMEIVKTLEEIALAVEAKEVVIAVKNSYQNAVQAVNEILATFDLKTSIRIGILPEIYPAGDEVITIYETTGKIVPPGSIPLSIGVAVFNVETILNTYWAMNKSKPVHEKYLTIAGEVKSPVTRCVPIGTTVAEVLKLAGGATVEDPVFVNGGPMTGKIVSGNDIVTKTTNAILVFPKNHYVVSKKTVRVSTEMKRAISVCCQCERCTDLCPRNLLGHPIKPHAFMRGATSGNTKDVTPFLDTFFCSQCGLCEMYACEQGLSPRTLIGTYKDGLRSKGVTPPKDVQLAEVNKMRNYRKVPMSRLTARLGLTKYNIQAPLIEEKVLPKLVKIPMSQHIGAPAIPVVKEKDQVVAGQMIAKAKEKSLSVPCHASIEGEVIEVNDRYVIIKSKS